MAPSPFSTIVNTLTKDLDAKKFEFIHPRRIPLIRNPLTDDTEHHHQEHFNERDGSISSEETRDLKAPSVRHNHQSPFEEDPDTPPLRFHNEASTIQLFYDLFFVANLTTFTSQHEVNSGNALRSYIGYFSLLWFTWFQVALFDVRFGHDSVFERVMKAIQFGVMVGLSIVGPLYDLNKDFNPTPFQTLSLILMVNRLILALQYGVAWYWLRGYKKAHIPMGAHVVTMFISAMVQLGLSFGFGSKSGGLSCLDGWYVLAGIEAIVILTISTIYPFMGFRKTNIIERLGLLTLIILGEGIISLGEVTGKIQNSDQVFSSDVIGLIISGVLIIFLLYMLYFDQIETEGEKVGTFRQEIWSLFHFPFHISILLIVEGFGQFIVWRRFVDYINKAYNIINSVAIPTGNSAGDWTNYAGQLGEGLNSLASLLSGISKTDVSFASGLQVITDAAGNSTQLEVGVTEILGTVTKAIATSLQVQLPKSEEALSQGDFWRYAIDLYSTVFSYFFISSGVCLILLAWLFVMGKKHKSRIEYLSMAIRFVVGLGLALLATMQAPFNSNSSKQSIFENYILSPWMPPTVVLAYILVVGLDVVLIQISKHLIHAREHRLHDVEQASIVSHDSAKSSVAPLPSPSAAKQHHHPDGHHADETNEKRLSADEERLGHQAGGQGANTTTMRPATATTPPATAAAAATERGNERPLSSLL